ncbi:2-keto-3-deoxygluconate kinase [Aliiroseovarius sediminilitoris]|uniref:2-keto-3-deoxygluconate kinase n=1 Tax=Aliiroseovarius sediminilitoris TaxID=1173584 RepID=A0A1I0P0G2_9RHOB|nr:sugar kinase [Aliiroseovarius sediminilitoris]SEW07488.1 2-keto-3-deoxygluconate kinase [Aliiroseovarius sediminilitoris]
MRVLSIGECMAELSPQHEAGTFRLGFAGDTFNTAWYLARISPEINVSYFTGFGSDSISAQMREMISEAGIDHSNCLVVPDRTVGLYLISLDHGERSFSYWRGQSAARCLASDPDKLGQAIEGHDLIYFSGITLAILDASGRATLLSALRTARINGKLIAFDPNLRPRLWEGTDTMLKATMEGAQVSDIVLPSFEDEATWFKDATPKATANRYLSAGGNTIVVKNGADEIYYRDQTREGTVPVPPIAAVIDTTAAGDSFNAAILAGTKDQSPLPQRIALACRLSAAVVQARGALVPINAADFKS